MKPTQAEIDAANAVLEAAQVSKYWPRGSHLIAKGGNIVFDCMANMFPRDLYERELTASELKLFKQIPEIAKVLK